MPGAGACCQKMYRQIFLLALVAAGLHTTLGTYCRQKYYVTTLYTKYISIRYCCPKRCWFVRQLKCFYRLSPRYRQVCCPGYIGCRCQIPICVPKCRNGGVCVAPNTCRCPSTYQGAFCQTEKCSYVYNCYPGFCVPNPPRCTCAVGYMSTPQFKNCAQLKEAPMINKCYATIVKKANPNVVGSADTRLTRECSDEIYYTNMRDIDEFRMYWNASFMDADLPKRPAYVLEHHAGIVGAHANVVLYDRANKIVYNKTEQCLIKKKPTVSEQCDDVTSTFSRGITHQQRLDLELVAVSGGYKVINNVDKGISYTEKYGHAFNTMQVKFRFDTQAPLHCLQSTAGCPIVEGSQPSPIQLSQDMTKNATVEIGLFGWNDNDSNLRSLSYTIYKMSLNGEQELQENRVPVDTGEVDVFQNETTFQLPVYTLPGAGMYSFIGHVMDMANNTAYARSVVLYDENSTISQTAKNVSVKGAYRTDAGMFWFNQTTVDTIVDWKDVYANKFLEDNGYLKPLRPFALSPLDVNTSYSNLSIHGVPNQRGIVEFRYILDEREFKDRETSPEFPSNYILPDPSMQTQAPLQKSKKDGEGFYFWVLATDVFGNRLDDYVGIGFDSSPPLVTGIELVKATNVTQNPRRRREAGEETDDGTEPQYSALDIKASDIHSGVDKLYGELYDVTDPATVVALGTNTGRQNAQRSYQDKSVCQAAGSCVCNNYGQCFNQPQVLVLDHCHLFVNHRGRALRLRVFVYNGANLMSTADIDLGTVDFDVFHCKDEVRSCEPVCAGTIVGIVIALLLLIVIILLIIFILIRKRQHKPLIPEAISLYFSSAEVGAMRRRNHYVQEDHRLQPSAQSHNPKLRYDDDDVEIYGSMEVDPRANWLTREDSVQLDKLINQGHFDIWKAKLNDGGTQVAVAAKLKDGAKEDEIKLLKAKMNFFARSVEKHPNLVNFLGAINNEGQAPILLFELCDIVLRDWLKQLKQINDVTQAQLITFVVEIAAAMAHLHKLEIVHRRLGTRNVLLRNVCGRFVTKVTGFGPMIGKEVGDPEKAEEEKVPIKWMAPEQLGLAKGARRTYNEATDVWSYGVTLWEIFSKAQAPYKDIKRSDVKHMIDYKDYRLEMPLDCPPFIYDDIMEDCWQSKPALRPSFNALLETLNKNTRTNGGDVYYGRDGSVYGDNLYGSDTTEGTANPGYADSEVYSNVPRSEAGTIYDDCFSPHV